MTATDASLDALLRPRGVAVVGASSDPGKRGFQAVRALLASGYAGGVFPVNPRGGTLLGLDVHRSLDAVPGPVDLALVCTPAATAPEVVAACGRAGVATAVLLAVGFGESGEEGRALEGAVAVAARAGGVRLVGPNTSGLMNLTIGLNLIGARDVPRGSLGLLVQSGNLALNVMLDAARRSSVGLSVCVGVGNELDLGFPELLEALAADDATRAVLLHAEGFRRGAAFLDAAARTARAKPVVALKAARSAASARAALSHTGAVAGGYAALRAALGQAGVVEVTRSDELFPVGEALATQPPLPPDGGLAILSDGGGHGTLAVDALEGSPARPARLAPATRAALRELLGPAAAVDGPVDLAGRADADPGVFPRALELLADDPDVGAVLVVGLFGGYAVRFDASLAPGEAAAATAMAEAAARRGVALVVHTMYAPDATPALLRLREAGVPVMESLEVACRAAAALAERGRFLARPPWRPSPGAGAGGGAAGADADPRALDEPEARELVARAGVPLVPATLCGDADAAAAAARAVGGPVAVKAVVRGVAHKTDAGGVALDVRGEAEARDAFFRVTGAAAAAPGAGAVRGALVSPMLDAPLVEVLVGARRDPTVGTVLTVGAGGAWVEALADVAVRALPVDRDAVAAMLGELRLAPLLRGARGRPPADVDALVEVALALAGLMEERPEVEEAELNPVFATPGGATAVDARVVVRGP